MGEGGEGGFVLRASGGGLALAWHLGCCEGDLL